MNGLRSLLRLEEKVAAEGRRIQNLGGQPLRWLAPTVLMAAIGLHAAILLLPAVHSQSAPRPASPLPDFPRVWRAAPPPVSPPQPAASRSLSIREAPRPAPDVEAPGSAARAPRAMAIEPVPEPPPELVLNVISADVEAIIPNPDAPPPSLEIGPPARAVPAPPPDTSPALVESAAPVYPIAARSLRAEGRVRLRLAVLPDGTVSGATVEECTRPGLGFEAAALEAVKKWRYEPAPLQSGARRVVVSIHFQQQEARP
jgi:protein TonB